MVTKLLFMKSQSQCISITVMRFHMWVRVSALKVNLQSAINDHWAHRELHYRALQLHDDVFDGVVVAIFPPSYLDVEVVVIAPAWRGQDVVAGGVQLEHISIKGLVVEFAPSTANLAIVDGTYTFREIRTWSHKRPICKCVIRSMHDSHMLPP